MESGAQQMGLGTLWMGAGTLINGMGYLVDGIRDPKVGARCPIFLCKVD